MDIHASISDTQPARPTRLATARRRAARASGEAAAGTALPPVIVIGGTANSLSIARRLAPLGVRVYTVNRPVAAVRYSRFARWIPLSAEGEYELSWADFLLGPQSEFLRGAVLLAASDVGLRIVTRHRAALAEKFQLDLSNPAAQSAMLDKLSTYRAAVAAGVPAPRFWTPTETDELHALRDQLVYPLLIKPKLSFQFTDRFPGKFFVAEDFDAAVAGFRRAAEAGVECLLMEKIPGPDDRLCSYYTYLDEQGEPQFHFTKRIIRRNPPNMGLACYHVTDWTPEVRDLGLRLLQSVGLRGLGNVEFKFDDREGTWKLIECNARFTEANGLLADSGLDLAKFVYQRIVGLPTQRLENYQTGVRLWYPLEDCRAFLALRARGQLTTRQWLSSLLYRKTLPLFRWTDPLPSFQVALRRAGNAVRRRSPIKQV